MLAKSGAIAVKKQQQVKSQKVVAKSSRTVEAKKQNAESAFT